MNSKEKLLSKLVSQFRQAHHGQAPREIVVEPVALVALGLKKSVAPSWEGIPVRCREIAQQEVARPGQGKSLAVILDSKTSQIVASDLVE